MSGRYLGGSILLSVLLLGAASGATFPSAFGRPAFFVPPHTDYGLDLSGDGLYNYLVVEAHVYVDERGLYEVEGSAACMGTLSNATVLDPGIQSISLWFYGWKIRICGIDGPYTFALTLRELAKQTAPVDTATHTTAAYSHLDFSSSLVAFDPPHRDYGYDEDGDGRYDYLVIDVNVTSGRFGGYELKGNLYEAPPEEVFPLAIAHASTRTSIQSGDQTISLWFEGGPISASGVDGPYWVKLTLRDVATYRGGPKDAYWTEAYSHLDFDLPAAFASPHADYGEDRDDDGLFDVLVIDVNIQVDVAAWYEVRGFLWLESVTMEASSEAWLETGPGTMSVEFDGGMINASRVSGPYVVNLTLGTFENDIHVTGPYNHLDFEEPPAIVLAPPHVDYGLDTDGNGLYDYLVIEVSVSVTKTGSYGFYAAMSCCDVYVDEIRSLDAGLQLVPLLLEGFMINISEADGPYELWLYVSGEGAWDSEAYMTGSYGHLDFESPPASLTRSHVDFGLDRDEDGLFNYLVLEVDIQVWEQGRYYLSAWLNPVDEPAWNETVLELGPQTVALWFSGTRINASERDAPYVVYVALYVCSDPEVACGGRTGRGDNSVIHLGSEFFVLSRYRHDEFEEAIPELLPSTFATTTPVADGILDSGEWDDAFLVNLSSVPGNEVAAFLEVKNDDEFLHLAFDVVGDETEDGGDFVWISFDTHNDQEFTPGREDQFFHGGTQGHYVHGDGDDWAREDSPYDETLLHHVGLKSSRGFGPTVRSETAHRIYEFAIPLDLLNATVGSEIGFFIGAILWHPSNERGYGYPGVSDSSAGRTTSWPLPRQNYDPLSLDDFADLVLFDTRPTVTILSPSQGAVLASGDVGMTWDASDLGSGLSHLNVSLDGQRSVTVGATETGYTFVGLADGPHSIVVTAVDASGHSRSDEVRVIVDTTPPGLSLFDPPRGQVLHSNTVEVSWRAGDNTTGVAYVELRLDSSSPVRAMGGNYTLRGVSDGFHTLTVTAADLVGNAASITLEFRVDTFLLSPTGPYGGLPLVVLSVLVGSLIALYLWKRKRRT